MKKITFLSLILIVTVGVAWAGCSYWFGLKTEEQFSIYLQRMNQPGISVQLVEYDRGFLKSIAQTVIVMKVYSGQDGSEGIVLSLPLQHTIIHGPLIFGGLPSIATMKPLLAYVVTKPVKVDGKLDVLNSFFSDLPLVQHTLIHFDGSGETRLQSANFDKEIKGAVGRVFLKVLGSSMQLDFGVGMNTYSGTMRMDGFTIQGEQGEVGSKNISAEVDIHQSKYGLALGTASVHLDELSLVGFAQGDAQKIIVKGVSGESLCRLDGPSFFCRQQFDIDSIQIAGHLFGPLEYDFELRNIDAAALGEMQKQLAKLQVQNSSDPKIVNQQLQAQILRILPQLLSHSPEFEITKARISTSYGEVTGRMLLRVQNPKGAINLFALLGAVHFEFDAQMPEALLLKVSDTIMQKSNKTGADGRQLINQLVQQGFVKLENDVYSSSMHFEKGKFFVNDINVPLQNLLQKIQTSSKVAL